MQKSAEKIKFDNMLFAVYYNKMYGKKSDCSISSFLQSICNECNKLFDINRSVTLTKLKNYDKAKIMLDDCEINNH